jgi:hypothetical protein
VWLAGARGITQARLPFELGIRAPFQRLIGLLFVAEITVW